MLNKKCNFALCVSKIDEEAMDEFEFAYVLFFLRKIIHG